MKQFKFDVVCYRKDKTFILKIFSTIMAHTDDSERITAKFDIQGEQNNDCRKVNKKPIKLVSSPTERNKKRIIKQKEIFIGKARKVKYAVPQSGNLFSFGIKDIADSTADLTSWLKEKDKNGGIPSDKTIKEFSENINKLCSTFDTSRLDELSSSINGNINSNLDKFTELIKSGEFGDVIELLIKSPLFTRQVSSDIKMSAESVKSVLAELKDNDKMKSVTGNLIRMFSVPALIAILTASIITCLINPSTLVYVTGGLALLALLVMGLFASNPNLFTDLYMAYKGLFETKPQIGSDTLEHTITAVTACFMGFFIQDSGVRKTMSEKFLHSLGQFDRSKKSLSDITSLLLAICESTTNFVRRYLLDLPSVRFVETNNEAFNDFQRKMLVLNDKVDNKVLFMTHENFKLVKDLEFSCRELIRTIPRDIKSQGIHTLLHNELHKIQKLRSMFIGTDFDYEGLRQEPVGVLLKGGPGTGKSISMEHLYTAICSFKLNEEEYHAFQQNSALFVHNRQSENKYWEGYDTHKLVVYFDDFGQVKDVAGVSDGEFMSVMRAINTFQNDLHMAGIEKKGCTAFNAKFVICSTNMDRVQPESIISWEALMRRFNKIYIVVPKPEYTREDTLHKSLMERRIDFTKLPPSMLVGSEEYVKQMHPDSLHFYEEDMYGKVISSAKTFETIVSEILHLEKMKAAWFESHKLDLTATREKYRKMWEKNRVKLDEDIKMETVPQMQIPVFEEIPEATVVAANLDYFSGQEEWIKKVYLTLFPNGVEAEMDEEQRRVSLYIVAIFELWGFLAEYDRVPFEFMFVVVVKVGQRTLVRELCSPQVPITHFVKYKPYKEVSAWEIYGSVSMQRLGAEEFDSEVRTTRMYFMRALNQNPVYKFFKQASYAQQLCAILFLVSGIAACNSILRHLFQWIKSWFGVSSERKILPMGAEPQVISVENILEISLPQVPASIINEKIDAQSFNSSDKMKSNKNMAKRIQAKYAPQMSHHFDPSGHDLTTSIVKSNCYDMLTEDSLGLGNFNSSCGYILFVADRYALMPFHFVAKFNSLVEGNVAYAKGKVKIVRNFKTKKEVDKQFEFIVTIEEILAGIICDDAMQDRDSILVRFPERIMCHRNIMKYFVKSPPEGVVLFKIHYPAFKNKECFTGYGKLLGNIPVDGGVTEKYTIEGAFAYKAATGAGDCGALVVRVDPSSQLRKIIGIHVAGNTALSTGFAAVITEEMLVKALKPYTIIDGGELPVVEPTEKIVSQGQFDTIGILNPSPRVPRDSSIIPSRLYGLWKESTEKPARLKKSIVEGVVVDPLYKALDAYCVNDVYIEPAKVRVASEALYWDLEAISKVAVERRLFTYEEAVLGLVEDPDFTSLNRGTSAGYPYNCERYKGKTGKKRFFSDGVEFDLTNQEAVKLQEKIENEIVMNGYGIRTPIIYTDTPKDELLPKEKVAKGKVRLFNNSNVHLLIKTRMFFGAFQLWIYKNRIANGCAIGLNPYQEWDVLARYLGQYSTNYRAIPVEAGDFSRFDASEMPIIHHAILNIINRFYEDEHTLLRQVLWQELVASYHVLDGVCYQWPSSLPSGHPLTSLVNCLYNLISFRICFTDICGEEAIFRRHVYLCVMGDDNIFSVSREYRDKFTGKALQVSMAKLGLTYTPENKEGAFGLWRDITEVEFLKRGFRFEETLGRYVAPWRLDVLLESPYWTQNSPQCHTIVGDKIGSTLRELSLHSKVVFDEWAPRILKAFVKHYRDVPVVDLLPADYYLCQKITLALEKWY